MERVKGNLHDVVDSIKMKSKGYYAKDGSMVLVENFYI